MLYVRIKQCDNKLLFIKFNSLCAMKCLSIAYIYGFTILVL